MQSSLTIVISRAKMGNKENKKQHTRFKCSISIWLEIAAKDQNGKRQTVCLCLCINNANITASISQMVCLPLEISPKKPATLSHSNFEPIVPLLIGEYLLLIISIIIIYWFRNSHPKGKKENIYVHKAERKTILNVNVQLTQWNWRAHLSITRNCLCSFGWSLSIGIELRKEVMAEVHQEEGGRMQVWFESESEKQTQRDAQKFRQLWMS